ncbi:UNVERIFIED_CONTAM: Fasciclin-like arabinogalactan protein 2, partial [Sesamum indicum]
MKLPISILSFLLLLSTTTYAHNITRILAQHPDFSTFNHYLTTTHLAAEINRHRTITVCVVDNAAMNNLLSKHFSLYTIKNILSLHIFADYFGSKKLHQITKGSTTTSSLFQATGEAAGTSGYVNITDTKGGKVGFSPVDSDSDQPMATYVKSIEELPYNISVIQISHILSSPEAEAPTAVPTDLNLTSLMAKQGCKTFSDLITAQGTDKTFTQSVEGGLTIFCPSDDTIASFMPRSSNGLMNTLATKGANKFDFTVQNDGEDVKIETKVVTATIRGTLVDEDPLAVYKIDKVLLPRELFKVAPSAPGTKSAKSRAQDEADAPGPAGDEVPADENSSNDGMRLVGCGGILTLSF